VDRIHTMIGIYEPDERQNNWGHDWKNAGSIDHLAQLREIGAALCGYRNIDNIAPIDNPERLAKEEEDIEQCYREETPYEFWLTYKALGETCKEPSYVGLDEIVDYKVKEFKQIETITKWYEIVKHMELIKAMYNVTYHRHIRLFFYFTNHGN